MDTTNDIVRALGRVEGQMKALADSVIALTATTETRNVAIEQRVTTVEMRVSRAYGVAVGLGLAGGLLAHYVPFLSK